MTVLIQTSAMSLSQHAVDVKCQLYLGDKIICQCRGQIVYLRYTKFQTDLRMIIAMAQVLVELRRTEAGMRQGARRS